MQEKFLTFRVEVGKLLTGMLCVLPGIGIKRVTDLIEERGFIGAGWNAREL